MDWLRELRIDIDRLEHFEEEGNDERIAEYKDLIVSHVKSLLEESKYDKKD